MLPAMSNLLQVCYRTEVFDSARPFCANSRPNSIGTCSAERAAASLHPLCLGTVGAPPRTSLCLSCALPRYYPQQQVASLSSTSSCFVQDGRTRGSATAALAALAAVGRRQIHCGGCYPHAPTEILPMGGNGVSLSRQIDSLPRSPLGSSCPGTRVNAKNPPSTTPEDPSVRLVWKSPPKRKAPNPLAGPSLPRVRTHIPGSFGSFVQPRAPSRCCPCIAHAAGKSIPPSPSLIPFCHQASLSWKSHFYPACTLSFHPSLLLQGWPLSLSLHPFQRFLDAVALHWPSCPRDN